MLFFCIFVLRSRKRFRIRSSVVINVLDLNGLYFCGEAAHLIASVRLALPGSHTWQRLPDGFRSAHQGKSFSGLPMNVLPGVSRESDGGHEVTDFGLSIELKQQRSVPVGNGASRKSDIPNEVGDTFSDVQRAEGADG